MAKYAQPKRNAHSSVKNRNGYSPPRTTLSYSQSLTSVVSSSSVASSRCLDISSYHRKASHRTTSTVPCSTASSYNSARRQTVLLTVFWAAPLVLEDTEDENLKIKPMPMLNFRKEESELEKALSNTKIKVDLKFDFATTDRISNFLIQRQGKVLHYSGHGHEEFLAIENGWGKMHKLAVEDLKEWIAAGENSLLLVFVSACHSRAAGEAFIKAGVKHVVCCQRNDQQLRNDAAIEFEKAFYQALAEGHNLQDAFNHGKKKVVTSHLMSSDVAQAEAQKFVLLPERANHDVVIFDPSEQIYTPNCTSQHGRPRCNISTLPVPPENFVGRQIEMYNVISSLQKNRIVRLTGQQGVGLKSIACAACWYIQDRFHIFNRMISDIVWLNCEDDGHIDFSPLLEDYTDDSRLLQEALTCALISVLQEKQWLFVLDARSNHSTLNLQKVLKFICEHSNDTRFIVLEHFEEAGQLENSSLKGKEVHVELLPFLETLTLFRRQCPCIEQRSCPHISNLKELQRLVTSNSDSCDELSTMIGREFYEKIGAGLPNKIYRCAQAMTGDEYDALVRLGKTLKKILSWKISLQLHTRAELEAEELEISNKIEDAIQQKDFELADEFHQMLHEIDVLRKSRPGLEDLLETEKRLTIKKSELIDNKNFLAVGKVQKELDAIQLAIAEETLARREAKTYGIGLNSHSYLQNQYIKLVEAYRARREAKTYGIGLNSHSYLQNQYIKLVEAYRLADEQDDKKEKFSALKQIRVKMEETLEKLKEKPSKEYLKKEIGRLHKLCIEENSKKRVLTLPEIEYVEKLYIEKNALCNQLKIEIEAQAIINKSRNEELRYCLPLNIESNRQIADQTNEESCNRIRSEIPKEPASKFDLKFPGSQIRQPNFTYPKRLNENDDDNDVLLNCSADSSKKNTVASIPKKTNPTSRNNNQRSNASDDDANFCSSSVSLRKNSFDSFTSMKSNDTSSNATLVSNRAQREIERAQRSEEREQQSSKNSFGDQGLITNTSDDGSTQNGYESSAKSILKDAECSASQKSNDTKLEERFRKDPPVERRVPKDPPGQNFKPRHIHRMQLASEKIKKLPNETRIAEGTQDEANVTDSIDGGSDTSNSSSDLNICDFIDNEDNSDDGSASDDSDDDDKRDNDFIVRTHFVSNEFKAFKSGNMDNMKLPKPNLPTDLGYTPVQAAPNPKNDNESELQILKESRVLTAQAARKSKNCTEAKRKELAARLPQSGSKSSVARLKSELMDMELATKPQSRSKSSIARLKCELLEMELSDKARLKRRASANSRDSECYPQPGAFRERGINWDVTVDDDDDEIDVATNSDPVDTQPEETVPVAAIVSEQSDDLQQMVVDIIAGMNVTTAIEVVAVTPFNFIGRGLRGLKKRLKRLRSKRKR